MTVFNLGSINADHFYRVPHLPAPGETLAATGHTIGLGGKGANQSVAVAKAGSHAVHIGAVGSDGAWAVERIKGYGVNVGHIATVGAPTAHAIINVDDAGENAIVIFSGANKQQDSARIMDALSGAGAGDTLLLQNETSHQVEAAKTAQALGLKVVYSAAPFDAEATARILPHVSLLVVNQVEADQLSKALGLAPAAFPVAQLLITKGADGAIWRDQALGQQVETAAFPVSPVDTTGAGDCFIGYTVAGMDQGMDAKQAMRLGAAASAIKVTRHGTADAIPDRAEVNAFLAGIDPK